MTDPKTILEKMLSSEAKAELLTLFNSEPKLTYNTESFTDKIGRPQDQIKRDVEHLIEIGLLSKKKTRGSEVIRYERTRAEELQKFIAKHITYALESD